MIPFFTHRPDSLSEFIGQDEQISSLTSFFTNFKKGQGLFLYGPPGTGKTSVVHAFAKEYNYDLLELNASDTRKQSDLKDFLSRATGQMSLFGTKKLILLDEIDGLSGTKDRGAPSVVASFLKSSSFPIVVIGVNVFDKKLSAIKKSSKLVEFNPLPSSKIFTLLQQTVSRAKLSVEESQLKIISRNAAGDVRAALNDLFVYALVKSAHIDESSIRRKTESISHALIKVFKSTDPSLVFGSFDLVDEDLNKIFLWLDQNIPSEYTSSEDLNNAYAVLAHADRFFGRIRRWQYYRFYVYCYALLSVGIALSKKEKYSSAPAYKQPTRLLRYWQANMQYAKRKAIVGKLASLTRISSKRALQSSFHLLLPALASSSALQEELELSSDEVKYVVSCVD